MDKCTFIFWNGRLSYMSWASLMRWMMIENLSSVKIKSDGSNDDKQSWLQIRIIWFVINNITNIWYSIYCSICCSVEQVAYIDRYGKTNIHYYTLCFFSDGSDDKKERKPCIRKDCGIPQIRYYGELRAEEFGGAGAICDKARHCQRVVAKAMPRHQTLRSGQVCERIYSHCPHYLSGRLYPGPVRFRFHTPGLAFIVDFSRYQNGHPSGCSPGLVLNSPSACRTQEGPWMEKGPSPLRGLHTGGPHRRLFSQNRKHR